MGDKITIRDVAESAGVSISSVHIALSGKKGVSDETRELVRKAAQRLGYQPNANASHLKRRTQRLVVLLPDQRGSNHYFYPPIWKGIDAYLFQNFLNLECRKIAYSTANEAEALELFRTLLREEKLDGFLTVGHTELLPEKDWDMLRERGIPVVLINSDRESCEALCCVKPDYEVIGRTMAELMVSHVEPYGSLFLCAGNPAWKSHALVVKGFEDFLEENDIPNMVYKNFSWTMEEKNYIHILRELSRPDIAACGSVFSQGTILLGRALEARGKTDVLYSVGSDLSEETADRIQRGILNNVIHKNPYAQGYVGIKLLAEYLVNGAEPENKSIYVGSEVVFRSNLPLYQRGSYRMLL